MRTGTGREDVDAARNAAIREAAEEAHLRVEAHEMVVFAHWIPPAIAEALRHLVLRCSGR